ncbi:MAG: EAL domain-containing protein [Anaerolineales bacterium]|nr:EAL domain-containing protein [Anaerolineales bacterium]
MTPNRCVLIADDAPLNRKTLQALLAPLGYPLAFAADGPETLAKAAELLPDLILLDVMMPAMDGLEVCRRLRADPQLAEVPVILVTSLDDRASRLRGIEAGADDFISKPFDRAELRGRVETILRLNRYRRLLDERAKFERLVDLAPEGILLVTAAGLIQLANPALRRLLALPETQPVAGASLLTFVAPDARPALAAALTQVLTDQTVTRQLETALLPADGPARLVEITFSYFPGPAPAAQLLVRDIGARKRAEADLRLAARVLASAAEGIVITDTAAQVVSVNQAYTTLTGFPAEAVVGRPLPALAPDPRTGAPPVPLAAALAAQGQWQGEVWVRRWTGELFPAWLNASVVRDDAGDPTHVVQVFADLSARHQAEERVRVLAHQDTLTGLPNRALFHHLLRQALSKAQRNQRPVAVLFADLDRFKNINDTLGHGAGDQLLRETAGRLRACLRESDTVARLSGDEFAVLLEDLSQLTDVVTVAQKILAALAAPYQVLDQEMFCTGSLGISMFPEDGQGADELLKHADAALYRAKEQGRNAYMFYTADMYAVASRRLALESSLRRALERREFQVYYQPRVHAATGRVAGMEALLRWQHPELGLISPAQFIEVAEETGLIVPIGAWVLHTAAAQAQHWARAGFPRLRLSVNVSVRQFRHVEIVALVAETLRATGLAPDDLELEVTESLLLPGADDIQAKLHHLRAMGVHLAIDDFGTGYSSLDYLKRLPVDRLKIDRAFVRDIATPADDGAIVRAIIDMAHDLNLRVTAEGVETQAQLGFLQAHACDETQGFFFGAPTPPEEFVRFLS